MGVSSKSQAAVKAINKGIVSPHSNHKQLPST